MIGGISRVVAAALVGCAFAAAPAALAADGLKAILVLDASGSMWGEVDGRAKIEIARDTVGEILGAWRDGDALGLVAYGHRTKGSCDDIEVIAAPGPVDRAGIRAAVDGLVPKGKTPMTAAVRQAAEALRYTEGPATVILVSDGEETCGLDPCAVAEEMEKLGVGLTVHAVGFDLKSDTARAQLACLAEKTGGRYVAAADAGSLAAALAETVAVAQAPAAPAASAAAEPPTAEPAEQPAAEPAHPIAGVVRLAPGSPPIDRGVTWQIFEADPHGAATGPSLDTHYDETRFDVPPGSYVLRASLPYVRVDVPVTVEAGRTAPVEAVLDAGTLIARAFRTEGQVEPERDVTWRFTVPGANDVATNYDQELVVVVPAGTTQLTAALGEASATAEIAVAAGETVERDIVAAAGTIKAKALFAAGGPQVTKNQRFDLVRGSGDAAEVVGTVYDPLATFLVPPGSYRVRVSAGEARAELPVEVKPGGTAEVAVVLDAGLLAVAGNGFRRTDIAVAGEDIYGDRKVLFTSYDDRFQIELPAGDYTVIGHKDDDSTVEVAATVAAGKRAEAKLP